jgi:four helix bundle protein
MIEQRKYERSHERLMVWQEALQLVRAIYETTKTFPKKEQFGLTAQMRRAAISIASNIAEGAARFSTNDKLHFFHIARASLSELETQMEVSAMLSYLQPNEKKAITSTTGLVARLLNGLIAANVHRT